MSSLLRRLLLLALLCWTRAVASPIHSHHSPGEEHIVIVNSNHPTPPRIADVMERLSLHDKHPDVRHIFNNSAFQGFAATMQSHCLDKLALMSDISLVEKSVHISSNNHHSSRSARPYDTRADAPWGLQRISTASSVTGDANALSYTYSYTTSNLGSGADIYIIDTGIYTANQVFTPPGRARMLWSYDNDLTDHDGHGTHVAGTAAGNILGVASLANIFGLKALGDSGGGYSSSVVAAIDQAIQSHDARRSQPNSKGSIISMSLESPGSVSSISHAILAASRAGIHIVVAAGNSGQNACLTSPASSGGDHGPAITVGAISITSDPASFSNHGSCVDLYAPGVSVVSSWIGAPNMVNVLSGTSMATPHVTGLVACAISGNATLAGDVGEMKAWVKGMSLVVGDGVRVANNGVGGGEALLGRKLRRGVGGEAQGPVERVHRVYGHVR